MSRQMIEAAGTRDDRLLGREPAMRLDAVGDLLAGLDIGAWTSTAPTPSCLSPSKPS